MYYKNNLKMQPDFKEDYSSLNIQYEEEYELAWYRMNAQPRPCFNPQVVGEIREWFEEITSGANTKLNDLKYIVLGSSIPNVFCLGGDLDLFLKLIRANDRDALLQYDIECIKPLYLNHIGLGRDITSISLVQGDALGGGFESAVSSEVVIAERSAKMGLPDILFNLFPGAGAYSFLSRKVGVSAAEKMILSGKLYTAEEMYDIGVVDVLAEDGEGEKEVYNYIKKENKQRNGYRAFRKAKQLVAPVTMDELVGAAEIWADAAMRLEQKDLRMMERLVKRQTSKF